MVRTTVRMLVGAGAGAVSFGLREQLSSYPILAHLEVTSALLMAAGLVLGWAGLGAALLTRLAATWIFGEPTLGTHIVLATVGVGTALVKLALDRIPRFSPALGDARSAIILAASFLGYACLYAPVWSALVFPSAFLRSVTILLPTNLASLLMLVPPLMVLRSALVPERRQRHEPAALVPVASTSVQDFLARLGPRPDVATSRPRWLRRAAALALATVCIALVTWSLSRRPPTSHWLTVVYLLPLYWAAHRHHLQGSLLMASYLGVGHLIGVAILSDTAIGMPGHYQAVDIAGSLLLVWAVAVLMGAGEGREAQLVGELSRSNRQLRRDVGRCVNALTATVEQRDAYTEGHLDRVNEYATEVGLRMRVQGRDLELLKVAATLHDIGKIGIPDRILQKRGALDSQEQAIMQRHPEIGARLLETISGLEEAAPLVLHHQERYDGKTRGHFPGYPGGLVGEQIPLQSRIIAVVDAFDAMTTDRPYRRGMTEREAIDVLRAERGRQFDPEVVDTFLDTLCEKPWGEGPIAAVMSR